MGAVALLPALPIKMQCETVDYPPTVGPAVICDSSRCALESATFGVSGAEGYFEVAMACHGYAPNSTVSSGTQYFGGGGNTLNPARYITIQCPTYNPYIVRGTPYSTVWD